jgi:hypothetical protein
MSTAIDGPTIIKLLKNGTLKTYKGFPHGTRVHQELTLVYAGV